MQFSSVGDTGGGSQSGFVLVRAAEQLSSDENACQIIGDAYCTEI